MMMMMTMMMTATVHGYDASLRLILPPSEAELTISSNHPHHLARRLELLAAFYFDTKDGVGAADGDRLLEVVRAVAKRYKPNEQN